MRYLATAKEMVVTAVLVSFIAANTSIWQSTFYLSILFVCLLLYEEQTEMEMDCLKEKKDFFVFSYSHVTMGVHPAYDNVQVSSYRFLGYLG